MVLDEKVAMILMKLGHLAVQRDRDAYLKSLADLCAQTAEAERCSIYLVDHEANELYARAAQRIAVEIRLPIGQGIAGAVAKTGETINVPDAYADPRFDRGTDVRSGYRTQNMLVIPVWSSDGKRVIGVIQVLNKRLGAFERWDQMYLERIAGGVGPALEQMLSAATR